MKWYSFICTLNRASQQKIISKSILDIIPPTTLPIIILIDTVGQIKHKDVPSSFSIFKVFPFFCQTIPRETWEVIWSLKKKKKIHHPGTVGRMGGGGALRQLARRGSCANLSVLTGFIPALPNLWVRIQVIYKENDVFTHIKLSGLFSHNHFLNLKEWSLTLHHWEGKSLSRVWLFATPWTVAHQAPQSMGFFRQEYWSGLLLPSPGDFPDQGIEPGSPALQTLLSEPPGEPHITKTTYNNSRYRI